MQGPEVEEGDARNTVTRNRARSEGRRAVTDNRPRR